MNEMIGPVLSDKDFFAALDYEGFPALEKVKAAAEREYYAEAKREFRAFVRGYLSPEKFFTVHGKVEKPELTKDLKATAERALRHEMVSCGTPCKFEGKVDWYANPTYNGYKEWPWQLSRHDELHKLARAYRACGDERYAEGCAELLDSWIKQATCPPAGTPCGATLSWRTIECGIRLGLMWPEIIHTFLNSSYFDDALMTDFFKSVYEHCVRLRASTTRGNWFIHEVGGVAQSCILYPFFKESGEWLSFALDGLSRELKEQVYPDGFQFELTTGYHGVVINHYLAAMNVAKVYGVKVPEFFTDTLREMTRVYVDLMQADGRIPNVNDGGHGLAQSFVGNYIYMFPDDPLFRWALTDGKEGKAPDYTSLLLPYAGYVIFRTGWFDNGITAFFDAGPFGEAHQHEDKLNLLLYGNGKQLLCEGNTYAYDTSDMRKYVLSTAAHNTARVNGMGQNRRAGYRWLPEHINVKSDAEFEAGESIDRAKGVYNEGYGAEKTPSASHERRVVFIKKPLYGQALTVVVDEMKADCENEYEFIWHYNAESTEITAQGASAPELTQFICGDTGEKSVVKGQLEPEVQGWTCPNAKQHSELPVPTLLHRVKGSNTLTVNLFSVHKADEESPVSSVTLTDDGKLLVTYRTGESESFII